MVIKCLFAVRGGLDLEAYGAVKYDAVKAAKLDIGSLDASAAKCCLHVEYADKTASLDR